MQKREKNKFDKEMAQNVVDGVCSLIPVDKKFIDIRVNEEGTIVFMANPEPQIEEQ